MNIYEGSEKFIFVSYAHADSDRVLPIIEALDREGFRIWYDSGIEVGSEWPAYIADHIKSCYRMIFFVSKASVNSKNCRREVNLADSQNKEILVVYLESTELLYGLDLQLLSNQAINRNKFDSDRSFVEVLARANILKGCQKSSNTVITQTASVSSTADTEADVKNMIARADDYYKKQEYVQAFYWYQKAAEQGNVWAQFRLGWLYDSGQGVTQDYNKAVYWYQKSAEQGNAYAQHHLGYCYDEGHGVTQDYNKAVYWYQKAAEQGDAYAQNNLGYCYYNAQGVPQDYSKAAYWYQKAAEQGIANAQFSLGYCYSYGQGVTQDKAKAAYWYQKAAEQGHARAQFSLGSCYQYGQGVTRDKAKAAYWYQKAVDQGYLIAKDALEALI